MSPQNGIHALHVLPGQEDTVPQITKACLLSTALLRTMLFQQIFLHLVPGSTHPRTQNAVGQRLSPLTQLFVCPTGCKPILGHFLHIVAKLIQPHGRQLILQVPFIQLVPMGTPKQIHIQDGPWTAACIFHMLSKVHQQKQVLVTPIHFILAFRALDRPLEHISQTCGIGAVLCSGLGYIPFI